MAEKNRMEFYRLEDRVLFEAGAVVQAAEAAAAENTAADDSAAAETPSEVTESENGFDMTADDLAELTLPADPVKLDYAASEAAQTPAADVPVEFNTAGEGAKVTISTPRELVVINTSVADTDSILASLNTNQEVLFLESGKDAMAQINDYLDDNGGTKYSAIHFVTHGGEGFFTMAGEIIRAENADTAAWAEVGEHLTDGADLMFYGCDLAANEQGEALCGKIAGAAGADVAASTDTTGISGNWALEFAAGSIETDSISVENYAYDLATFTVTNTNTSGEGSLAQAVADLSSSSDSSNTITIQKGLGTIYTEGTLTISKAVTIEGNGVIIDGRAAVDAAADSGHRILTINSANSDIVFDGITFQNGYNSGDNKGGAVFITAAKNVTFTDSNFIRNIAVRGGGAIYVDCACNLTINGGSFVENQTTNQNDLGGGAINAVNKAGTIINLDGVHFKNNVSGGTGGAILTYATNNELNINNTIFEGNKTTGNKTGGAISFNNNNNNITGMKLTLTGTNQFIENSSVSGGAIHVDKFSSVTISEGTVFEENTATSNGGALYFASDVSCTITGAEFTGNTATSSGGAIYISGGTNTITGAEFTQNFVSAETARGGAVYLADGTNTFTNAVFTENSITDTSTGSFGSSLSYGGAVYIANGTNTFTDSIFEGNSANVPGDNTSERAHGGAVAIGNGTVNTFKGVTFRENLATNGGAILVNTSAPLYITDSIFEKNKATASAGLTGGGSALATLNHVETNISIERSGFTGNEDGGAALLFNAGNIIIADSTIAGNTGEGIFARKSNSPLTITLVHSTVAGNTGVSIDSGETITINLLNSIVVGNADKSASGIAGDGTVNIYSSIYESTAANATDHTPAVCEVADYAATFGTGSLTMQGGGGKTLMPVKTVSVGPVTYHRNAETGMLEGVTAASGLLLGSNTAAGEVRSMDGRSLPIKSGIAAHLVGAVDPGIYVAWSGNADAGKATAYYSTLQDAVNAGGTIYLVAGNIADGKTVTVSKDVTLIGQGADKTSIDGGSGYRSNPGTKPNSGVRILDVSSKVTVVIDGVTFQNGYTNNGSQGGAITLAGGADMTITNSDFYYNCGVNGGSGAIFLKDSNTKLSIQGGGIYYSDQITSGWGVAIRANGGTITLGGETKEQGVRIANTIGTSYAVYLGGSGNHKVQNCVFADNSGVALCIAQSATVKDSEFTTTFSSASTAIFENCIFYKGGEITGGTATIANSVFTGALSVKGDTTLKVRDTAFTGASLITNQYHQNGTYTTVFAERCIFTDNTGSSVQINSNKDSLTTTAVFADCTFTGNKNGIEFTSSKDIAANITLIHCTIAGNTGAAVKNSSAYVNTVNIINSIVVGDNNSGAGLTDANGTLTYNVYNSVYEKADGVTLAVDTGNTSMTYAVVFGGNVLGDNGGDMESLKPVDTFAVTGSAVTYCRDANGNLTGVKYNNASYGTTENMTESARSTDGRGMPLNPTATAFTVGAMELNKEDNLYVAWSGNEDASAAGNIYYSTLQAAVNAGGTIYLIDKDIRIEGTITVSAGKNVVIKGQGTEKTVLDGMGLYSIMNIVSGATVSIDGVAFLNGSTSAAATGGAITTAGTLTITNSLFKGNKSTAAHADTEGGGAIYATVTASAAVSISGTTFTGNSAVSNGGAVFVKGTEHNAAVNLTNNVFAENSANGRGGAVWIAKSFTSHKLTASGNEFTGNYAGVYGGAMGTEAQNSSTVWNISDSTFEDNSAKDNGGAIYLYQGTLNLDSDPDAVTKTVFADNSGKNGGALAFGHSSTTINAYNTVFEGNNATTNGGAVFRSGSLSGFNFTNSIFTGNSANSGGAIYGQALTADGCVFDGNTASGSTGGAIYLVNLGTSDASTLENSTLINNTAKNGGAVACESSNPVIIRNTTIADNTATQNGGAIYGSAVLISCTVTGNSAQQGSFAYIEGGAGRSYTLCLLNSIAVENTVADGGSLIYVNDNATETNTRTVQIINSIYGGTIAESAEGAIDTKNIDTFSETNAGKWTAANLFSGTETTASGQVVYKLKEDSEAALNGVYIHHSSDWKTVTYSTAPKSAQTLFLGTDASAATEPVKTDQIGKTITRAAIGSAATDLETPSLTVTIAEDKEDAGDSKISFREALMYAQMGFTAADGTYTITFDSTVTSITLGKEIQWDAAMTENLVIDGGKNVTITAAENTRMFQFTASASLTFQNITLKANGTLGNSGNGGMFLIGAAGVSLKFDHVVADGGVTRTVNGSKVTYSHSNAGYGGMIYSDSADTKITVSDSKILSFRAEWEGGFVKFNYNASNSTVTATNSLFQNVSSSDWSALADLRNGFLNLNGVVVDRTGGESQGGLMVFRDNSTGGIIENSTFSEHTGCITSVVKVDLDDPNALVVKNSTFSGFDAGNSYSLFNVVGGSFYLLDSTVADMRTGKIINQGSGKSYIVNSILTVSTGNTSVALTGTLGNITVANSIFSGKSDGDFNKVSSGNYNMTAKDVFGDNPDSVTGISMTDYTAAGADLWATVTPQTVSPANNLIGSQIGVKVAYDGTTAYYHDGTNWIDVKTGSGATTIEDKYIISLDQTGANRFADGRTKFTVGALSIAAPTTQLEFTDSVFRNKYYNASTKTWLVDSLTDEINYDGTSLTFREALSYADNGDTIKFDTTVFTAASHTIILTDSLGYWAVAKSLTVDGLLTGTDRVVLTVQDTYHDKGESATASRLLYINTGLNVTLKDLQLYGGKVTDNGGVIYMKDTQLTLDHVEAGKSYAAQGGVIYAYDGNHSGATILTIKNGSVLLNGTASSHGGLIHADLDSTNAGIQLYLDGVSLQNGKSENGSGGAVAFNYGDEASIGVSTNDGHKSILSVKNTKFENNSLGNANNGGAALAVKVQPEYDKSNDVITPALTRILQMELGSGSEFIGNKNAKSVVDIRGAVDLTTLDLNGMDGVTFKNNTENLASLINVQVWERTQYGNTVDSEAMSAGKNGIFRNLTITGNNVGSGVLIASNSAAAVLANSYVSGNTAGDLATAASSEIYLSNTIVGNTFTNGVFTGNGVVGVNNIVIGNGIGTNTGAELYYNLIGDGDAGTDSNNNIYGVTAENILGTGTDYTTPTATGYAVTNGILTGFSAYNADSGYTVYISKDGSAWTELDGTTTVTAGASDTLLTTDRTGKERDVWGVAGAYQTAETLTMSNDYRTIAGTGLTLDAASLERNIGTDLWISCETKGWRIAADLSATGATLEIVSGSSVETASLDYSGLALTVNGTLTVSGAANVNSITNKGVLKIGTLSAATAALNNVDTSVTFTGKSIFAGTYWNLTVENNASLAGDVTVLRDFVLKGTDKDNVLILTGNSKTLTVNDSGTASTASKNIQFADLSGVKFVNRASAGDGKVYLDSGNELKNSTSGAKIVILSDEVAVNGTSLTYGQALSAAENTTATITTKRGTPVNATYSFVNGSTVPSATGNHAVTVSVSDADYYVMPTGLTANVTVGKAVLTVTFNEAAFTKIYNGGTEYDFSGSAYKLTGQQNGDKDFVLTCNAVFDKATVDATIVTMSNFVLGGTNAGNYTLSFENGTEQEADGSIQIAGKISLKDLTVTISDSNGLTNGGTIEYGTEVSLSGSYGALAPDDTLTFNITTDTGKNSTGKYYNAGEHAVSHGVKIMDGETDVTGCYEITFEGLKTFTVTQKALTGFTASKVYDKTATLAGTTFGLAGKIVDDDTVSASMADQTLSGVNAGTYTIGEDQVKLSGADAGNYIVTEDVAVTVAQREIHISSISGTYGETVTEYATNNGTGSALVDGDTISGLLTTDPGALNGNYVAGTHTVTGFSELAIDDGNGGNNYLITNDLTTFTVDRRKVTVGFTEPLTKTYDGTDVYTLTGSEYDLENVLSTDSLTLAVDSAAYNTILADGADTQVTFSGMKLEGTAAGNYILVDSEDNELTTMDVAGQIDKRSLTVTVSDTNGLTDGGSAVYGTKIEFGVSLTGMAETDTGTFNVTTDPGFSAGNLYYAAGKHTVDAGIVIRNGETDVTGCYDITYEGVSNFTVTKREITVTADDASKYEGDPDPAFTYTVTGDAAEGETIGVTVQQVFGNVLVPAVQVSYGNYDVTANYNITAINGTLTIQEKPVIPGGGSEGGTEPAGEGRYVDAAISNPGTTSVLYTITAQPVDGLPVSNGNPSLIWQDDRNAGLLLGADSNGVIFDQEIMRKENGVDITVQDPYLHLPDVIIDFSEKEHRRLPFTAEVQVDLGESFKMKTVVVYAPLDYTFGHRDLNRIGDDVDELSFDEEYKSGHKRRSSFDLGVKFSWDSLCSDTGTRNLTVNGEEKSFAGLEIRQAEGTLPSVAFDAAAAEDETAGLELAGDPLQLHRASACQDEFDELLEAFLAV